MDHRDTQNALDNHLTKVRTLAFAFVASAVAYIIAAVVVIDLLDFQPMLDLPTWIPASVTILQLPVIFLGYFIPHTMIRSAADTDTYALLSKHTSAMIIAAAIRETAVVIAFVLTLLTADTSWVAIVGTLAIISSLVHWPRRNGIEEFINDQRRRG